MKWFCLRCQPKHEHMAAGYLQKDAGMEVFLPRIRFRRATKRGRVWVTEALFPNYLFARFEWEKSLRHAQHAHGVQTVVHFGNRWPAIPDESIEELRHLWGGKEIHVLEDKLETGDTVRIVQGPLQGMQAVVSQALSSRERVAVLLDFLGRQTCVEVSANDVVRDSDPRQNI
ncbi:MAG TPA: transcription termination/antitermination NusG family protein [Verrucomicrobiae bacterium]|nr:transcription termination/antitermination NusG family protein [Verrucomicrobiae bacterium]